MKIRLRTNIDAYNQVEWPVLSVVPRKGEIVFVHSNSNSYCEYNKIPKRLEVSQVYYYQDIIEVDLWFNEIDHRLYNGPKILEKGHNRP